MAMVSARRGTLFVKTQAAVGSAEVLVDADAIRCREVSWEPLGEGLIERLDEHSAYAGGLEPVRGSLGWRVTFKTWWAFPGTKGTLSTSPLAPLILACPFKVTETPATSVLLQAAEGAVVTTHYDPCTIAWHEATNGTKYQAHDCVGKVKFVAAAGGLLGCEWEFTGQWSDPGNASLVAPTFTNDSNPPAFKAATLALPTAGSIVLGDFEFDPGFAVSEVTSPDATNGFRVPFAERSDYSRMKLTVASQDEATFAAWTNALAVSGGVAAVTIPNQGATRSVKFELNAARLKLPVPGEANDYRTYGLELVGLTNSGDPFDILIL